MAAVATVGAVSCTMSEFEDSVDPSTVGAVLYANAPDGNANTRVEFEEQDDESIAITWQANDSFALYGSNNELVDDFTTIEGDGKFTSKSPTTTLKKGEEYTAKFNETADLSVQDGDKINNMNAACQMESTFTYNDGNAITFDLTKAIMTFKFTSVDRPAYLEFKNGDLGTYKVTYKELEPDGDNLYVSHIMIEPCAATTRTLTFTLYNSSDEAYDTRSVKSSKAYEVGKRYTSPVSDLAAEDNVPIAFKDPKFKAALLTIDGIDKNGDDQITYGEAKAYKGTIDVGNKSIASMDEIKYFTAITELKCFTNYELSALDVSSCTALEKLYCSSTGISELDVSNNKNLTYLYCDYTSISKLDVSNNVNLGSLYCSYITTLKTLNVTGCTALKTLYCNETGISALNVSSCIALTNLQCYSNASLATLNAAGCTALETLHCYSNASLATLNIEGCTALKDLKCYSTGISALGVSSCTALENLDCNSNASLATLNAKGCLALAYLRCQSCSITDLILPESENLTDLSCYSNRLKTLDISGCPAVGFWEPSYDENMLQVGNQTTDGSTSQNLTLVVSEEQKYNDIEYIFGNNASENNANVTVVEKFIKFKDPAFKAVLLEINGIDDNYNGEISEAEAAAYKGTIKVVNKGITSMDEIKYFTAITELKCYDNSELTALDVSSCTALEELYCFSCSITDLILPESENLTDLYCFSNRLATLDISGCPEVGFSGLSYDGIMLKVGNQLTGRTLTLTVSDKQKANGIGDLFGDNADEDNENVTVEVK